MALSREVQITGIRGKLFQNWARTFSCIPELYFLPTNIGEIRRVSNNLFISMVRFLNRIYHPNIDEVSGTVCLDVINQAWTALYDLSNIFESFLPQLLTYPNPIDPLNGDAAAMYLHKPEEYKDKIREYVRKYATEEALKEHDDGSTSSESSLSDFEEDEAEDMEL
uniref:Ubiquitin-conjugating enzyme E2 H-like n=1 Tax=Saccoglossus kowalevskii TaxID=10224 RepID=A0ABM0M160_SACKO|nr:PREDICTED: ubiquitin-conjugating enzyme E2 H-like [Saccoglossus kowalevskii]